MDPSLGVPWLARWAYLLWPAALAVSAVAAAGVGRWQRRSWKGAAILGATLWAVASTVGGQLALDTDDVDGRGVPRTPWLELGMLSPLHRDAMTMFVTAALADPAGPHGPARRHDLLELLDRSSSCDPHVVDWLFRFGAWRRGATRAERCLLPDAAGRAAWIEGDLLGTSDTFLRTPPRSEAGWELATASHILVGRWEAARAALGPLLESTDPAAAPPWRVGGLHCVRDGLGALEGDARARTALARGAQADDPMVRAACDLLQVMVMPEEHRAGALAAGRHAPPLDWLRHLWLASLADASDEEGAAPFVAPIAERAPFAAPPSGWIYTVATWDRALARPAETPAQRHHRTALATHRATIATLLGDLAGAQSWLRFAPEDGTPASIRDNWRTIAVVTAVARGALEEAERLLGDDDVPARAVLDAARGNPTSLAAGPRGPWDEGRLATARAAAGGDGHPLLAFLETEPPAIEPWMTWVAPRVHDGREAIARHLRHGPVWDPSAGSLLIDTDLQQLTLLGRMAHHVDAHEVHERTAAVRHRFAEALAEDRRRGILLAILEAL